MPSEVRIVREYDERTMGEQVYTRVTCDFHVATAVGRHVMLSRPDWWEETMEDQLRTILTAVTKDIVTQFKEKANELRHQEKW